MRHEIGTSGLIVVIDLKDEINFLNSYKTAYDLYKILSVKEFIESILCVPACDTNFYDVIWGTIDNKLNGDLDKLNVDALDIFIDTSAQILDEKLRMSFPDCVDYSEYVLDKWIGNTSIVLKRHGYYSLSDLRSIQNDRFKSNRIDDFKYL
jgi:hypothetical protein